MVLFILSILSKATFYYFYHYIIIFELQRYTAHFPDIPVQQKVCMTVLDEQYVSMGVLISPLKFAQRQVFIIPTNVSIRKQIFYYNSFLF